MGIINWILEFLFGGKKKEEVKKLDKAIKVKETETKELEKKVTALESKKKVNKKEVASLKRKVTTTKNTCTLTFGPGLARGYLKMLRGTEAST